MDTVDVAVVGAGQAGLAAGYFLRRAARDAERGRGPAPSFVLLDAAEAPGGAWPHCWDSLRLFSPASVSSLPGHRMPPAPGPGTPDAEHVVAYLADYEERYGLPVRRDADVAEVARDGDGFRLTLRDGSALRARAVVSATGSWRRPFVPLLPGSADFAGRQLHAVDYRSPTAFRGQRVLVVGGGNSGAQIAADLLLAGVETSWACRRPPRIMPDDVDGRVLFQVASARVTAGLGGAEGASDDAPAEPVPPPGGVSALGDIVAVAPVRRARDERGLHAVPPPTRLSADGAHWGAEAGAEHGWLPDDPAAREARGTDRAFDAIVWCTGFRPDLAHLRGLTLATTARGVPRTRAALPTSSADLPGLYLLGYGDWCGPASATLMGVGVWARRTVDEITARLARGDTQG